MATERMFFDQLGDWKRSCYCGEPRVNAVGKDLTFLVGCAAGAITAGLFSSICATVRHQPDGFQSGSRCDGPRKSQATPL